MKTISLIALTFLFIFSCTKEPGSSVVNRGPAIEETSGGQLGGDPPVRTGGTESGGGSSIESCTGEAALDGYDDRANSEGAIPLDRIYTRDITLSGIAGQGGNDVSYRAGLPPLAEHVFNNPNNQNDPNNGKYRDPVSGKFMELYSFNETFEHERALLSNDGPIYLRMKVLPQLFPADDVHGCYERNVDAHKSPFPYSRLRFTITSHSVVRNTITGKWSIVGGPSFITTTDPIELNQCGGIIKVPQRAVPAGVANEDHFTVFEISDVRSDLRCQQGGEGEHYCPAEFNVKRSDCWRIVLQIATNRTEFFKGHSRF